MKRLILLLLIIALAGVGFALTGCQTAEEEQEEAQTDVAGALEELETALAQLAAIDSGSTTEELDDAKGAVSDAWKDVQDSVSDLDEANQELLQDGYDTYQGAVDDIPDDATIEEAAVAAAAAAQEFEKVVADVIASY